MKLLKYTTFLMTYLLLIISASSCYYDNEEELYPDQQCDVSNVTYSEDVAPILQENCNSCHNSALSSGGVITDNYQDLMVVVSNGRFEGAVNHLPGYSPMPQGGNMLPECSLLKINAWLEAGAPEN